MGFEALPERLAQVRAELARRAPQQITIVAVTKGFGTDAIRAALDAGLADIGENRVQEAVQKQEELGVRSWGFVGTSSGTCSATKPVSSPAGSRWCSRWIRWTLQQSSISGLPVCECFYK